MSTTLTATRATDAALVTLADELVDAAEHCARLETDYDRVAATGDREAITRFEDAVWTPACDRLGAAEAALIDAMQAADRPAVRSSNGRVLLDTAQTVPVTNPRYGAAPEQIAIFQASDIDPPRRKCSCHSRTHTRTRRSPHDARR